MWSGLSAAILDSRFWMLDFFLIERWELDVGFPFPNVGAAFLGAP